MNGLLILQAVGAIVALTLILATGLVLATRWLAVVEDPRLAKVERMLPRTNCGACGYPGCHAFAEALVAKEALPSKCSVGLPSDHLRIATYLGIDVGDQERRVARLACAGGSNVAKNRAQYDGLPTCAAAAQVAGGGKACFWGCIGLGDCDRACDFDAIEMNSHHLPVVDEARCTACGDCVEACPKDLFSIHAASHRLWVACSSLAQGDQVLDDCEVGCTACGRCASDAPGIIEMNSGLPVIDYRQEQITDRPTQRCPTGALVWMDPEKGAIKGEDAKKVIRQSDIHDQAT